MHLLEAKGALVDYADPYVPEVHGREWPGRRDIKAVELTRGVLQAYDCVVIVTDHRTFDYDAMVTEADSSSTHATRSSSRIPTCSSWARHGRKRPVKRWRSPSEGRATVTMETLFWASAFVIAYVYVGYPALLAAWARVAARPVNKAGFARRVLALDLDRDRRAQRSGAPARARRQPAGPAVRGPPRDHRGLRRLDRPDPPRRWPATAPAAPSA